MAKSRKERTADVRTRQEREDDALELHQKGYPYSGIADLLGVSAPTAKSFVKDAQIRKLKAEKSSQRKEEKILPFKKAKEA